MLFAKKVRGLFLNANFFLWKYGTFESEQKREESSKEWE